MDFCSVTDLSRMCGLSRARFYQLTSQGIFPPPLRNKETGRPYYDRDGQEECMTVQRTNRGVNGRAILFYAQRHGQHMPPPKTASRNGKTSKILDSLSSRHRDMASIISGLKHGLEQLGVTDVNDRRIRDAISQKYAVLPENSVRAETGASSRESASTIVTKSGECLRNEGFMVRYSADSHGVREFCPRTVDATDRFGTLKPRGDSDDAIRRLVESRSPCLPMDVRLGATPAHYIPAKDGRAIRDNTRSNS
jgi:hypothetical protein